jgi:hypothetical protein
LIAHDDVVLFGEQIDKLALGLVSPLQTNHACSRHSDPQKNAEQASSDARQSVNDASKPAIKDAGRMRVKRV